MGPFGAQFGQEYNGYYPPPYGPEEPDLNGLASTNAFETSDIDKEEQAKDALARFHYDRLIQFASDHEIWDLIDCLAFETIPLLREAQAIQKAITMLESYMAERSQTVKPWWLAFVSLNGQLIQDSRPCRRKITISELVRGLCSPIGYGNLPDGIGFICAAPDDAIRLVQNIAYELSQYSIPQPWLVLYPNGGYDYNVTTHSWEDRGNVAPEEVDKKNRWVETVGSFCQNIRTHTSGVLVGGCCKCGPEYVQALDQFVVR